MPTIVDAFLLGLAMRQGKWTGGIEDVADQLSLSDELGGELEPESVLMAEDAFRNSINQMVSIYLKQDIEGIDEWCNRGFTKADKDAMLITRNIKMAYRMDSLSQIRNTFFAVGAAHLAGDSGVIKLLRANGYNVDPVFSSSKISGDIYAAGLKEMEWTTVSGDNDAYTVQMPGRPSDYNMYGDLVKMKMFFDVTTMTFYLSGNVVSGEVTAKKLDEIIKGMVENASGKKPGIKIKSIAVDGASGREAAATNDDGSYRFRVLSKGTMVFMQVAGAVKKANINLPGVDKFFASFRAGKTEIKTAGWETFMLPDKAFSVLMPGKPSVNKTLTSAASETDNWNTIAYQTIDAIRGHYYMVRIGDVKEGLFLDGDSSYFATVISNYGQNMDTVYSAQTSTYKGFPCLNMETYLKQADANYRLMVVTRGNRWYMLIAGAKTDSDTVGMGAFFNSLSFLPYPVMESKPQTIDGFTTNLPSAFIKSPRDSAQTNLFFIADYYSSNSTDATTYEVSKGQFSPTYWVKTDTAYYNDRIAGYRMEGDTLLKKSWVQNGGVKGIDVEIGLPGYNSIKKVRLLVNGDSVYSLFAMIPKQYIHEEKHQQFFTDFRLAKEMPATIYTPKTKELMAALLTTDSLAFADALENLDLVPLQAADLPMLQQAMLKTYRDSADYYNTNRRLMSVMLDLADSANIALESFVAEAYAQLHGGKEYIKLHLLELLAERHTSASFQLMKTLLLAQPPAAGDPSPWNYSLSDSLQLTATLFPEMLSLAGDSLLGYTIISTAQELLDSGLINRSAFTPFRLQLMHSAERAWKEFQTAEYPQEYITGKWATALSWLNHPDANALLRQMLTSKSVYLKQYAITALLANNQPVSAAEVAKVAADKTQRAYFYDALQKVKKENLFPAAYATQKSLSESDLYNYLTEDYEDFTVSYVGERQELYKGKKMLFHLYRLKMDYTGEGKPQQYLAVTGPYEVASRQKVPFSDLTGFYGEEYYTPAEAGKLLKAYLEQLNTVED